MTTDLPIRCDCGKFEALARGVSPGAGTHITCYCDDCQQFQHLLGQAERVLDSHGGTPIFQMSAGALAITRGREHLACLRLTPKGTLRWYTSCCNAPLGNTLATPALPFVGVITTCFDRDAGGPAVDEALGPLKPGVFGKFARGDRVAIDAHDRVPLSAIGGFLRNVIGWRLAGAHRRSPFFTADGGPVATPWIVSEAGPPPSTTPGDTPPD